MKPTKVGWFGRIGIKFNLLMLKLIAKLDNSFRD